MKHADAVIKHITTDMSHQELNIATEIRATNK